MFIKDVKFATVKFDPSLGLGFSLVCGDMYSWSVACVRAREIVDVSMELMHREQNECLNRFAVLLFERSKLGITVNARDAET